LQTEEPYKAHYKNHDHPRQFDIWHWQVHLCWQQLLTWPQQQTFLVYIRFPYQFSLTKNNYIFICLHIFIFN